MRKLLVATDLSERGRQALERALVLAGRGRAELLLVHVARAGASGEELGEARRTLEAQAGAVSPPRAVRLRPMLLTGPVAETIAGAAEAEEAELILLGPHRRRLLADLMVGTTLERLLRLRAAPVLLVNRAASGRYRRVLAAVDLSEVAGEAVLRARRLGLLEDAELVLLYAYRALAKGQLLQAGVPEHTLEEHLVRTAREAAHDLDSFAAGLDLRGLRARLETAEGQPFEVIRDRAQALDADLVVVGTQGRSGIERAVLGSVAEQILRGLDRDVLAVPPTAERQPAR